VFMEITLVTKTVHFGVSFSVWQISAESEKKTLFIMIKCGCFLSLC